MQALSPRDQDGLHGVIVNDLVLWGRGLQRSVIAHPIRHTPPRAHNLNFDGWQRSVIAHPIRNF